MKNIILTSNGFINSSPRSKEIDELFKAIANDKNMKDIKKKALEHNEKITPLNDGEFIEVEYKCGKEIIE